MATSSAGYLFSFKDIPIILKCTIESDETINIPTFCGDKIFGHFLPKYCIQSPKFHPDRLCGLGVAMNLISKVITMFLRMSNNRCEYFFNSTFSTHSTTESDETRERNMVKEVKEKLILHWNYRGFTKLPEVIRKYGSHIQEIYLKWNQLSNLPFWIAELSNVTNLYLYGNQIESLPDQLGVMIHLTTLDLGRNKLESLPCSIGQLKELKILLLSENLMRIVPREISQLTRLETLSVSGNKLTGLPEWLGSLPRLEELVADFNCLIELPNRLTLAPRLSTISVCSNRLEYLPLNGFLSSPCIQFDCNPRLNYISLPVRYQLLQRNHCFRNAADIPALRYVSGKLSKREYEKDSKLRICLEVKVSDQETSVVILPRQIHTVHNIDENRTPSLWELALRQVYCNRFKHTLEMNHFTQDVKVNRTKRRGQIERLEITGNMYDLLNNGPASICLEEGCEQPVFTEGWIVVNSTKSPFLQLSVFCSRKCALALTESTGAFATNRSWCIV